MATILVAQISKKVPGAQEYSSTQASISVTIECHGDPAQEAERLYLMAEATVDKQLGIETVRQQNSQNSFATRGKQSYPNTHSSNGNGRRRNGSPPSTENQIRLLSRLLSNDQNKANDILQYYRVGRIEELTVSQASEVIDSLKSAAT